MFNQMIADIDKQILTRIFRTNIDRISNKQDNTSIIPKNIKMKHDESPGIGFTPPQPSQAGNNRQGAKAQPVRVEQKVGRNDPCPCGSEKKYKKCCGRAN